MKKEKNLKAAGAYEEFDKYHRFNTVGISFCVVFGVIVFHLLYPIHVIFAPFGDFFLDL